MNKYRYDYIDIAKGLGILAVVWAHIMLVGLSHKIIYAFHMPFFFFVAGMLFKREKYKSFGEFLKKRSKRLLVPYLIYAVGSYILWAGLKFVSHEPWEVILKPLPQIVLSQGSGQFMCFNSALWFIPCLFIVEIIYYFKTSNDWVNIILALFCAGLSFLLGDIYGDKYWFLFPFNFDAVLIALPFYCAGNILTNVFSQEKITHMASENKTITAIAWVITTSVLYVLSVKFGECSMGSSSYQCSATIFMIRALIGIVAMLAFSLILSNLFNQRLLILKNPIMWLGKYSLDVMCLHIPIKGIAILVIAKYLGITTDGVSENYMFSLIAFIVTMLVITTIIHIVNRRLRR